MYEPQNRRTSPLLVALVLTAFCVAGCGSTAGDSRSANGDSTGERVDVGDTEAILFRGEGGYGVVLAHGAAYDAASWEEQAREFGENGIVALAPEDTSPDNLLASVGYLEDERGVRGVALLGASAGGSAALRAAAEDPEAADQLIILSATGDVAGLGEEPKLFVASEGEGMAGEVRRMAEEAPGDRNEALVLPGDAHAQAIFETGEGEELMRAILERLEERG